MIIDTDTGEIIRRTAYTGPHAECTACLDTGIDLVFETECTECGVYGRIEAARHALANPSPVDREAALREWILHCLGSLDLLDWINTSRAKHPCPYSFKLQTRR